MARPPNKPKRKSKKDTEASPLATNIIVIAIAIPLISMISLYSLQSDKWVHGETFWLISRAAAVAAFVVLTLIVVLGLLLSHPRNKDTWRWTVHLLSWHQSLMAALFILIGLHLFFTLSDPKSGVTLQQVWFPIHARYYPLAMVAGAVAVYGLLIIMISLGLRRVTKMWLPLHRMSWLVWGLVFAHGVFGGTDTVRLQMMYWISAGVVVVTFYWRHWVNNQRRRANQTPQPVPESTGTPSHAPDLASSTISNPKGGSI
ncbi:hypothetical protein [Alicyclobacillus sp. SO9]|uniref:hypothetical protein n=1 Tax=Alicyclobacillus sp. SO9 TaxID=2665646 RepID=UPI0018E86878|nr:hypothetical protein [Alicyclobacillus sp. SO9]QQE79893.1 hypothetical protein GI364_05260 [Alicyclobacillus sp. SO9]